MRELLLLSTPWSQVRKLRLRRIGSLVKITQPVSDRQNYWYLSSGPPCMCSSPGHQAEKQREGAVIGVGGRVWGRGKQQEAFLSTEERRAFLTSEGRVFDHSHMSWRLWAMGSWDIRAGKLVRIRPHWGRGVTKAREVPGQYLL